MNSCLQLPSWSPTQSGFKPCCSTPKPRAQTLPLLTPHHTTAVMLSLTATAPLLTLRLGSVRPGMCPETRGEEVEAQAPEETWPAPRLGELLPAPSPPHPRDLEEVGW